MNTPVLSFQTRLIPLAIDAVAPLTLRALKNRQQYSDPGGIALAMGVSPALWPLSGLLWPSAYYLAHALAQRPVDLRERMLEIGCGLALPSLVSHRKGARITASDHNPLSFTLLRENLRLNRLAPDLPFRYGHWGDARDIQPPEMLRRDLLSEQYDFIAGSDLLYERSSAANLSAFIHRHARPKAHVWIVDANRGYRAAFKRHMNHHGFRLLNEAILNRSPCLSGASSYKGRLLKFRRDTRQRLSR